jgi:hypothetical protein
MSPSMFIFLRIMLFYIFVSYILFPVGFYYAFNHSLKYAGYGYVIGSIISILLWQFYGSKMI